MSDLRNKNTDLSEVLFYTVSLVSYDAKQIFNKLLKAGLDVNSLGFWVWDIQKNIEYYSPKFRETLGYENTIDFPDVPESWQRSIDPPDLKKALENYNKHVETGGEYYYIQPVTYNKKNGDKVNVICHGKVVQWNEKTNMPEIMVGVHLEP